MLDELPKKNITKEIIELLKGMSYHDACEHLDAVKGMLEFSSIVTIS